MRWLIRRHTAWLALSLWLTGCASLGVAETVDSLLAKGKELFQAGRYEEALGKFQEIIKRDPRAWEAYLYTARSYIAQKVWGPAIENGRKALELAPKQDAVLPVLGSALLGGGRDSLQRGQYPEAASRLREYLRLNPTDGRGYLDLARAHLGTGTWRDALDALQRGLGQAGDGPTRQEFMASLLDGGHQAVTQGDLRSGIRFLEEYVRHDPSQASAYLDLGKAYWQAGDRGQAVTAFRRVLELNPGQEEALRFLLGTQSR